MNITMKKSNKLILFICLLCSVHFFGLHYQLGGKVYDVIDFIYLIIAFLMMVKFVQSDYQHKIPLKELIFLKPIFIFFFCLMISSLSCYYYHEQFPLYTLLAMRYFAYFLIYFILIMLGFSKEYIIKIVLFFAVLYMVVFSIQLVIFPTAIVPLGRTDEFERGFLRLRLEGIGFVTLSAFYCLNNYLSQPSKVKYLLFYLLCFLFVFILGFRTLLATFILSSIMLVLIYYNSFITRIISIIILIIFAFILIQVPSVQDFYYAMAEKTNGQMELGEDYIRFLTFNFLFQDVNVNFGSLFFGNGMPFEGSSYGDLVVGIGVKAYGFISADIGLLGMVFNYGILAVLAFLNIFRIAIFTEVPKNGVYLKVFFFYLIISSITTAEVFRAGIFGVEMLGLYLITRIKYDNT
jgi:hypothetical protein